MGRLQKYVVKLTSDERKMLFELIAKVKTNKEKLNRARILLKADCGEEGENWEDQKIADAFYVSILTVQRTRQSLVEEGLENTLNRQPPKASKRRIIHIHQFNLYSVLGQFDNLCTLKACCLINSSEISTA